MSFWYHRLDQSSNKNIVRISALEFFGASWGLLGILLRLPGNLVSNIINKEAYKKPQKASRKPQGCFKNFQGRNLYNFSLFFGRNDDTKKIFQNQLTFRATYGTAQEPNKVVYPLFQYAGIKNIMRT